MDITKYQFEVYEGIRQSGATNMFDIKAVIRYSHGDLDKPTCLEIMKRYAELKSKYDGGE